MMTVVIGGSGKTGRRVVDRLSRKGVPVRIGSRSGNPAFDWDNPNTWEAVVKGVHSAYITYYPDLGLPGAADAVGSLVKLAVGSGVRRLVLLSGRGEPGAQRGEQAVEESGAEWTIVRSSFFFQNFSESFLADTIANGEIVFPAGQTKEPFIDVEDIADIAAAALTEDRHAGQLYEVTGPRLLTFGEAAAQIGKAIGRAVRYVPVTAAEYEAALVAQGLPASFAAELTALFVEILDGRNAYVTDGVESALGRAPRDFSDYLRDALAAGSWRAS
jgi:uncharacterized protein YbjT (DUF2867 family)